MITPPVDGQWLDFYALLDVPVNADEDTIRKRIGKVYAEASANSDHRDFSRRSYYQALVERVLPQCRRVLLDPEWRAKYDRQHILHGIGDPSAQDYVSFIASMRGGEAGLAGAVNPDANLPQRVQDEINLARQVVETAQAGTQLELLPSRAVKIREITETNAAPPPAPRPTETHPAPPVAAPVASAPVASVPRTEAPAPVAAMPMDDASASKTSHPSPRFEKAEATEPIIVETIEQPGEPVRAKMLTAQEAADIRRRRLSNPDAAPYVDVSRAATPGDKKPRAARVTLDEAATPTAPGSPATHRLISPTSLNLMVAITGVLLTITIQKFSMTPAEAVSGGRTPIGLVVSPEIEPLIASAANEWEKTSEGAAFDINVQAVDGNNALGNALGKNGISPDAWIPSNSLWSNRFNKVAARFKRDTLDQKPSVAQTPLVLIASKPYAAGLRQAFPNRHITSWARLQQVIANQGHFGLADPQQSSTGLLARLSMAREWGANHNTSSIEAAASPKFWKWMSGFENNVPSGAISSTAMIKDMALSTSGRYRTVIGYESDALAWMPKGGLEIYYLPRTIIADHPFCQIDRVGAPLEVARGRQSFETFLRSRGAQDAFARGGFHPTESVSVKTGGVNMATLPRDENPKAAEISVLNSAWDKRPNQ